MPVILTPRARVFQIQCVANLFYKLNMLIRGLRFQIKISIEYLGLAITVVRSTTVWLYNLWRQKWSGAKDAPKVFAWWTGLVRLNYGSQEAGVRTIHTGL